MRQSNKQIRFYLCLSLVLMTFMGNAQLGTRGSRQRAVAPPPTASSYVTVKDVHEEVSKIVPLCVTEFQLDDFEKEIFKNFLTHKIESENAVLLNEDIKGADRRKQLEHIDKEFYAELTAILTNDEIEAYKLMDFDRKKKKKKKRKKKKSKQ